MTPRRPEQWVGILITCTLHVPYHLEFTMIILPWLQQWGQRGLFPLRWERSRSQAVSRCEYTSSGSELLKAFFCGCVCIIASVEGACLSVLWLWGADSSPRVPPPHQRVWMRRLTHQYKHTHNTFSHKGAYPQNPLLMEATAVFRQVFMPTDISFMKKEKNTENTKLYSSHHRCFTHSAFLHVIQVKVFFVFLMRQSNSTLKL